MPKERLSEALEKERIGPAEVYVTLRDLIALQFEANGFSFLPKYAVQTILSGRHRSKLRGRGLDFDEVRKYVPGDDIRNIDWKVTARVGETHTKVYTEEKERPVFFVVDQTSSMFFGSQVYFKSVTAAHLLAVGCWRVIDQGDRVGGIVFNDAKIEYVTPKRDRRSIQRYLSLVTNQNQLLKAEKVESKLDNPLNKALQQANELVTHDFLVIVISDLYTANDETLKQLIRLRRNNDVIIAHVNDPGEFKLSTESITLSDGQYQTRLEKNEKVKALFASGRQSELAELKEGLKKYGMPLLNFHTLEEPARQLRSLLSNKVKKQDR